MFLSIRLGKLAVSIPGTDKEKGLWLKVTNCQNNLRVRLSNITWLQRGFR